MYCSALMRLIIQLNQITLRYDIVLSFAFRSDNNDNNNDDNVCLIPN